MSEGDSKPKGGVPSWQVKPAINPPEISEQNQSTDTDTVTPEATSSTTSALEDARRFLDDDEVKDASTDKKVAFLESKGLNSEEIQELLGIARNVEASNPETSPESQTPLQQPVANSQSLEPRQPVPAPPPQQGQQYQQYRDAPPVITYPEFLTTPASPPPLITASRLLNTLYLFGGLSTLLYGTTTYLVKPMAEALSDSRHELACTAQTNIDKFVEKLKPLVSEIPQPILAQGERYEDKDDDSSDGDPTEMFHRDIGVQTSPNISRPPSPDSSAKPSTTDIHTKQATQIGELLSEVDLSISSELHETSNLQSEIDSLKQYLDTLMYNPPAFSYGPGTAYGAKKDENDEIGRVKREIRAVKGVLLTARSFPGVGAGVR